MLDSKLVFREDNGPTQGFTNKHANRDQTDDDHVIRELIQNCLDASANGSCNVTIALPSISKQDIPFINDYSEAFEACLKYRSDSEPATGKQVISRIKQALASEEVPCLVCVDDGIGIGEQQLRALYGSGVSQKSEGSRGSVGHGHLTAFAPSDLRYVLYAGRKANGQTTFGGQAILASHRVGRIPRSEEGFIRANSNGAQACLFDEETGGRSIPSVIRNYLPTSSGSAAVIVGYKPIEKQDGFVLVQAAAVQHFLVALHSGNLKMRVVDSQGHVQVIDKHSTRQFLDNIDDYRAKGRTSRSIATLIEGEYLENLSGFDGVRIWFRDHIDKSEGSKSRVSIFRDGMWIEDNTLAYFRPSFFEMKVPFDAVVDLNSHREGSFGALVREAEGASHLKITPGEITNKDKKNQLFNYLNALKKMLLDKAEDKPDRTEEYSPPELKLMGGAVNRVSVRVKRTVMPHPKGSKTEDVPGGKGGGGGGGGGKKPTRQRVKPGNNRGILASCRPDSKQAGRFYVSWRIAEDEKKSGALGLRLLLPSGTDRTSALSLSAKYLAIASAESDGIALAILDNGKSDDRTEARIPSKLASRKEGVIVVDIAEPNKMDPSDFGLIEAEIVGRTRAKSK